MEHLKLGVLCSHNGTNLQAIIDACVNGQLKAELRIVIGNNSKSYAFIRAERSNIPVSHISGKTHESLDSIDEAILETLLDNQVNMVLLAGYMKKLGPKTLSEYNGRILNIHPSLLPLYGGKNMFGRAVHQAVLNANDTVTGASIHLVNHEYDVGKVLAQIKIPVNKNDTVDSLSDRVLKHEHKLYVKTLQMIERGDIKLRSLTT